jgi:hypothetical protein
VAEHLPFDWHKKRFLFVKQISENAIFAVNQMLCPGIHAEQFLYGNDLTSRNLLSTGKRDSDYSEIALPLCRNSSFVALDNLLIAEKGAINCAPTNCWGDFFTASPRLRW